MSGPQGFPLSCLVSWQDALIDMVRRSKVHFVHCLLPKAEAVSGGGEPRVTHGENMDLGLMTLDVGLLRAQLRGSKLLDALRIYRQGKEGSVPGDSGDVRGLKTCICLITGCIIN